MNRKPWLMNTRMKYLDYTLITLLGATGAGAVPAAGAPASGPSSLTLPGACDGDGTGEPALACHTRGKC